MLPLATNYLVISLLQQLFGYYLMLITFNLMRFNIFMEAYSVCGWQCFLLLFKSNFELNLLLDDKYFVEQWW